MTTSLGRFMAVVLILTRGLSATPGFAQTAAVTRHDSAVTYQINARHTGAIFTWGLRPPLAVKWAVDLGATVSYPLIAEGKVFVLAGDGQSGGVSLYALEAQTGDTVWGPVQIPIAFYWWAAAAYDHGTIFVVPVSAPGPPANSGAMYAYDASDGRQLWSTTLPGQYLFDSPPTALNGIVYTGGAGIGGTVYAVREGDGQLMWTGAVENGNTSSPVVTPLGVYVSYACPQTYKFAPVNGDLIWRYQGPCEGGGGNTPVLYNGSLYVRSSFIDRNHNGAILDATTGTLLGAFNSEFPPAFWWGIGFYVQGQTMTAFSVKTGLTLWTAAPAPGDSYSSPPIVVNGVVYVGTSAGNVLGYTAARGRQVVSLYMGAPISAPEQLGVNAPQSGLGAGEGLLIVPASTRVVALRHRRLAMEPLEEVDK